MEGEKNYESDISESWSLIDINFNEEFVSSAEVCSELGNKESTPPDLQRFEDIKYENLDKKDDIKLSEEESIICSKGITTSESGLSKEKLNISRIIKEASDDGSSSESCDADSIEILELDGNYRESEVDPLEMCTISKNDLNNIYHLQNDESSFEDHLDPEMLEPDLVKRKRRRKLRKYSNHCYDTRSCHSCENNEVMDGIVSQSIGHPVYRHYRNNVANTVLNLSMGVIFAGIACIAIGHFLGVQDAGESAEELLKALEKVQLENVALQSKLSKYNEGCVMRPAKSSSQQSVSVLVNENVSKKKLDFEMFERRDESSSKLQSTPVIPSNEQLLEWLSKVNSLLQKRSKSSAEVAESDLNKIKTGIQDQLALLNFKTKDEPKVLKILQKIMQKLTSNQENFEILYRKLMKLKNKLNRKLSKIFPDDSCEGRNKNFAGLAEEKRKVTVADRDLQSIQWASKKNKNLKVLDPDNVLVLHKLPQPVVDGVNEKNDFWVKENLQKTSTTKEVTASNSSRNQNEENKENAYNKMNLDCTTGQKGDEVKRSTDEDRNFEKNKIKKATNEKKENFKRKKRDMSQVCRIKSIKKKFIGKGKKKLEDYEGRNKNRFVSRENGPVAKKSKFEGKKVDPKRGVTKTKNKKEKNKVFMSESPKISKKSWKNGEFCYKDEAGRRSRNFQSNGFNLTGKWMFKWADGRQKSRRSQVLGDWVFERAKARKDLRVEGEGFSWQILRSLAREADRNDDRWYYPSHRGRTQHRSHFQDFSWI